MRTINVSEFHWGIADDIYKANIGQFSIAKHFDTLTYPHRLQPLRGMAADTSNTGIGNIIVASDGLMYGIGLDYPGNPTNGKIWQRSGYGANDVWQSVPNTSQLSGTAVIYPLLVEYVDVGSTPATDRTIFWAGTNKIVRSNKLGGNSSTTDNLTFTNIGQGFVHPKDKILYIPYDNKLARYNLSTSLETAILTLPTPYQIPCLTNYGNYLAIPAFTTNGVTVGGSIVYLWDRDTSLATLTESINWSTGQLKVINNLNGVLIGISTSSVGSAGGNVNQDSVSIEIKGYSGGTDPFIIKEIIANHLTGSSAPTVTINPNVNFIYKNRLYFSVSIVPNDGVSNSYYGLWSVGKNKVNGEYTVTMERMATNTNTETGVLAAAISGDFVSIAHTAVGTLTCSINGQTSATTYGATSVYESPINPKMPELERIYNKSLLSVGVNTLPLTTGQQVVMKYRVDSTGSWNTLFTKTSTSPDTNLTAFELPLSQTTNGAISGRNFEFRLESTGGAVITGYSYKYGILKTNL